MFCSSLSTNGMVFYLSRSRLISRRTVSNFKGENKAVRRPSSGYFPVLSRPAVWRTLRVLNDGEETTIMRYIIYGAGGIGGTLGAGLSAAGIEVVLIARGEHLSALKREGLTYKRPGNTENVRLNALGHPSEVAWQPDDVVIMTMKSQHMFGALNDLAAAAPASISLVCCQNGVGNEHMASRFFQHVYGMVVMLPATHLTPGVVLHHAAEDPGGFLDAGCYPGGVDATIEAICADLTRSGFSANADPRAMRWKYAKMLQNLGNAVQVVCQSDDDIRPLIKKLRDEALACYEAAGVDCASADDMRERFSGMKTGPIDGETRGGGSSWQSVERGTGDVEADYLNGEICLMGRLHDVATPANEVIRQLANSIARTRQPAGQYSVAQVSQRILDAT
ncbi:MAG: 2-dehydropantoate 2-reductase [Gammaproteobacteria bacterium]|nr:2-dehydropantoate 2-reductase [Gammaproteobacteria bacterium]